jgi:hypothetical protein
MCRDHKDAIGECQAGIQLVRGRVDGASREFQASSTANAGFQLMVNKSNDIYGGTSLQLFGGDLLNQMANLERSAAGARMTNIGGRNTDQSALGLES